MLAISGVAISGAARAQEPPMGALHVTPHPKASCIDEGSVRESVAERLGRDPFEPSEHAAPVEIVVSAHAGRLIAVLTVGEARRELTASYAQCTELRSSLALALAVLFEEAGPPSKRQPPSEPSNPTSPPPETGHSEQPRSSLPAPSPAPHPESIPSARWFVAAALTGHVARLPSPFLGAMLGVGYERAWWSLGVEVGVDPAVQKQGQSMSLGTGGTVSAALYEGTLMPCARRWWLAFCARASAGALTGTARGISGFSLRSNDQTNFVAALGARIGVFVPLPIRAPLDVLGAVDADAPLVGKTFTLGGTPIWSMPALGLSARVGVRLRL